jgi:outer membrane protein OmpA-like peptidoglycan-associated protein
VRLDTTNLAPGTYTVRAVVTDDRGLTGECSIQIAVDAPPPPPPPPQVSKLDECLFARNSARVDNVCKAKLDNVALRLQSEADATLAIVGYSESNETNAGQLATNRANNVRTYLQQDKGIAAGRLDVRTGTGAVGAEYRRVDLHLVPRGATFTGASVFPPVDGETPVVAEQEQEPAEPLAAAPSSSDARREVIARAR